MLATSSLRLLVFSILPQFLLSCAWMRTVREYVRSGRSARVAATTPRACSSAGRDPPRRERARCRGAAATAFSVNRHSTSRFQPNARHVQRPRVRELVQLKQIFLSQCRSTHGTSYARRSADHGFSSLCHS
eukprot:2365457-Pleurochrysis_carterae.AAC.2